MEPEGQFGFGTFELDARTGELRKRGLRLKLQARPVAVLALLVRRAGELVTQEELRKELWESDTFVDFEHSLGVAIWKLRSVLGDDADNPRFIETLPRRGYRFVAPVRTAHRELDGKKMLAVLPFEDLGRPHDDHFADGLTEELITQLGRLNPQRLGVIGRSSVVRYRGDVRPARVVAQELRAHFFVLGSVRRSANRLRITVQLVEASTEAQLWAESYDRIVEDVIAVQIEIAERIAKALTVELVPKHQDAAARTRASNLEAYEYYLQGRYHWNKRTTSAVLIAIDYFEKALLADPEYALGHAGLADCYVVLGLYGEADPGESFGKAKRYATRALELDGDLAEAHSSLGYCRMQLDWDARGAEHEHLQAIQLNGNCAPAHHWYGLTLTQLGRFPEALRTLRRAVELDPFSVAIQSHIGRLSYYSRQFDRAEEELIRATQLDAGYIPGRYFLSMARAQAAKEAEAIAEFEALSEVSQKHPIILSGLAYVYGKSGKRVQARQTIEVLKGQASGRRVPPYFLAMAFAGLANAAEAVRCLEEAYTERSGWLFHLPMEAAFDEVRSNHEFRDLVDRVKAATVVHA